MKFSWKSESKTLIPFIRTLQKQIIPGFFQGGIRAACQFSKARWHFSLVTRYSLVFTRYSLLYYSLLVSFYSLLVALLLVTLLLVTRCSFTRYSFTRYSLLFYSLLVAFLLVTFSLVTRCVLPVTRSFLLVALNGQKWLEWRVPSPRSECSQSSQC